MDFKTDESLGFILWRQDTQHGDIQPNDTLHNNKKACHSAQESTFDAECRYAKCDYAVR